MSGFIKTLKEFRYVLPRNTLKTIRGQALSGNLVIAKRHLRSIINNMDVMSISHKLTISILRRYKVKYRDQFVVSLYEAHRLKKRMEEL